MVYTRGTLPGVDPFLEQLPGDILNDCCWRVDFFADLWLVSVASIFRWVTILLVNILPLLYDPRFDSLNAHVLRLNASLFLFLKFYLCWAESTCLAVKTRIHHLVQWFQAQTKASLSKLLGWSKYIFVTLMKIVDKYVRTYGCSAQ